MRLIPFLALTFACRTGDKIEEEEILDTGDVSEIVDADADGYDESEDCDDANSVVNPGAAEICDGVDNNCDGEVDEGVTTTFYADLDGDGFGDADSFTSACEIPVGYVATGTDCDDLNPEVYPSSAEQCDGIDNDCDGEIDEDVRYDWYADADGDGFGDPDSAYETCDPPPGYVTDDTDCDDTEEAAFPGGTEVCDTVDNDCDGETDENVTTTYYQDTDGDGFGVADVTTSACDLPTGYAADPGDCDDADGAVSPNATEVCDDLDNDCDGDADSDAIDQTTFYADDDSDGFGDAADTTTDCDAPSGYLTNATDCDDADSAVNPDAEEVCDGVDNDCDGDIDTDATDLTTYYADNDGDGYGGSSTTAACDQPSGYADNADDCDDGESASNPGETEVCDDIDNDCDGTTDEAVTTTYYEDDDGDGYGDAGSTTEDCTTPSGYVTDATDCDDTESASNPGESEVCDEVDNDCDGSIDEGVTDDWYLDTDGDGYGDDDLSASGCEAPTAIYVADGGDCDDDDSAINPGASEGCDGTDYDCDGSIDNDADGDDYSDITCGGDDCDDADASIYPDVGGGCALGESCLDVQTGGYDVGDDTYTIDPDGYGTGDDPFDVYCDMTTDGGGWTLIAVNAGGGSWSTTSVTDSTTFGSISLTSDFKSAAWSTVLFTDLLFDDATDYAIYDGVDSGTLSYDDFQAAVPLHNCGTTSGYSYTMSAGSFSGGSLCSTNLYIHPIDEDGGVNTACSATYTYANNAYGPTWSVSNNNGCPLDDPSGTNFVSYSSATPWGSTLMMLVR